MVTFALNVMLVTLTLKPSYRQFTLFIFLPAICALICGAQNVFIPLFADDQTHQLICRFCIISIYLVFAIVAIANVLNCDTVYVHTAHDYLYIASLILSLRSFINSFVHSFIHSAAHTVIGFCKQTIPHLWVSVNNGINTVCVPHCNAQVIRRRMKRLDC